MPEKPSAIIDTRSIYCGDYDVSSDPDVFACFCRFRRTEELPVAKLRFGNGACGRGAPWSSRKLRAQRINPIAPETPFRLPSHVQRAAHAQPRLTQDVGINHRRSDVLVPEQLLHGANVIPII